MPSRPPPEPAGEAPGGSRGPGSALPLLQLTTFTSTLDRFAMPPMLVAMSRDLDVPLTTVVHAAGAYFLVYGLSQPLWGAVSDRLGRVRTMRLTLLLAGLCTLASAVVWSPLLLVVSRGLAGGFFGAAYPATLIYVGDTVPAERRQTDITRLMVGVATGTALASLGAGLLADLVTWRAAFVVTGIASLVLVVLLRRLPEPDLARPSSPWEPLRQIGRSPITLLVLLFAFTEGLVLLGALTLLPPAIESAGSTAAVAGAVTAAYGVAVYAGSRLVGRLARTWHPAWLILGGALAALLGCLLLVVSRAPAMGIVVAVLLGLAWTGMHSSLQTWATELLPAARASVVSLFAGSLFVGSSLGAVLVADLADAGRYAVVYAAYAALAVPLGLAATATRRRWVRP
ncbi:MFS transporter [Nocardioides aequoreus]|uniref:MFS transporter n=1 Tax=Nocardioides aequoreus TaxID=397278 RepID=UPI0004C3BBAB|nr:MFS transporter [Nocardioides aequoreus]